MLGPKQEKEEEEKEGVCHVWRHDAGFMRSHREYTPFGHETCRCPRLMFSLFGGTQE